MDREAVSLAMRISIPVAGDISERPGKTPTVPILEPACPHAVRNQKKHLAPRRKGAKERGGDDKCRMMRMMNEFGGRGFRAAGNRGKNISRRDRQERKGEGRGKGENAEGRMLNAE